jgi:hypothetical protein
MGIDTSIGKRVSGLQQRLSLPVQAIIDDYASGRGVPAISSQHGVAPMTIRKLLIREGVEIRNRQIANEIVAANKTAKQHFNGIQTARNTRIQNVVDAGKNGTLSTAIGPGELEITNLLTKADIPFIWQHLVDGYLIDIAVDRIAIEIKSRSGNAISGLTSKRTEHLIECGYMMLWIVFNPIILIERHASNIIAIIQLARSNPPPLGEHWMIRGSLYDLSPDFEANECAVVKYTKKLSS